MIYFVIWDLDSIFPNGSEPKEFSQRMTQLTEQTKEYHQLITEWTPESAQSEEQFVGILALQGRISNGFSQYNSFLTALISASTNDTEAKILSGDLYDLLPVIQLAETAFTKKVTEISAEHWQALLAEEPFKTMTFRLNELHRDERKLLSEQEENIINMPSLDGLNAWNTHCDTIVASIVIPSEERDGFVTKLSTGQAFNRMMGDPDKEVRQRLFTTWEKAWNSKASILADTLNRLDGFRLSDYKLHGTTDYLENPLDYNRMSQEILTIMWGTIQENKQLFVGFLARKAQLFGKKGMDWQDQDVLIILGDLEEKTYSFDQAAAFILENFRRSSSKMTDFAQMAFEKGWIKAEDHPGKRPGGYCTELPETQESRISITFGSSVNEIATLAHELGHAFHSSMMWDLPSLNREYAVNAAETASTFAELTATGATLEEAKSNVERINLLDTRVQNAIAILMNICARPIFENNFYQTRQRGLVTEEDITELMLAAQKKGYKDSLGSYHPRL